MIYYIIEKTFEVTNGQRAVLDAIDWSHHQNGGTFAMVDKFISLLDQEEFLNKKKAKLDYVFFDGIDYGNFFMNKICDEEKTIEITKRPGCNGFDCPNNIIALSVSSENSGKLTIIHKDKTQVETSLGVVSLEVSNQCINSIFFVSLLEGYLNDRSIDKDFIGIKNKNSPDCEPTFLLIMADRNGKTFLNFCPRNEEAKNLIFEAIPLIISLMPFVPRSIINLVENPLCATEIYGFYDGRFSSRIHLIDEPDYEIPFAYPVNKETLLFAAKNIYNYFSDIRFAITGECFSYKFIDKKRVETDIIYTDVDSSINSVFDPHCTSHLVLLVDKFFESNPETVPLSWKPHVINQQSLELFETDKNRSMISVASNIMKNIGHVKRSEDIFFVTLGDGFLTIGNGKIPDEIFHKICPNSDDKRIIKSNIHQLILQFTKYFTWKQKITEEIELKKLSSTDDWLDYPEVESERLELCDEISIAVADFFNLSKKDVSAQFIGESILAISIANLPENLVAHKYNTNNWDNSYQPCKADFEIEKILQKIDNAKFNVSQIVHEPTVKVIVNNITKEQNEKVNNVANKFGFLVLSISQLSETQNQYIEVELLGFQSGIQFAATIVDELGVENKNILNIKYSKESCMGFARMNHPINTSQ